MLKKVLFTIFVFSFFFVPAFSYGAEPVKILLVPGHDSEIWGSQYGNIREADMNLVLSTKIYNLLKGDERFKVWITRDGLGYMKEFADYFSANRADILSFEKESKKKLQEKIASGSFVKKVSVRHNKANGDMAVKLYGINKWVNDNGIDAVIHIHFNDYPRKHSWTKGQYKGFVIYVPERQMANSEESVVLAKSIFNQLVTKYATSTYKKEKAGIVPDQSLIALGSNDTLSESVRSILIEYGYIYRFGNAAARHKAYASMAELTVSGIKKYFFGE